MKFAVVTIERPSADESLALELFRKTMAAVTSISPQSGTCLRPSENCWLLTLPGETQLLGALVSCATVQKVRYRVLYFDQTPEVFDSSKIET